MDIVSVGECTHDRYIDQHLDRVGGISLNFAVHARRRGAGVGRVALVSCIGTDAWGPRVRAKLALEGVDAAHVHQLPGATAAQAIRLQPDGERIFPVGGYDAGVLRDFRLGADDLAFIASFDVVAAPYFRQVAHLFHPALRAARPGALRVADLLDGEDLGSDLAGVDEVIDLADVLFISGDERTVDVLEPLALRGGTLIVVTHGAGGSTALAGATRHLQPADPVPAAERLDTTGCGDAFQAAFTVTYAMRRDIPAALRAGATCAAQVIRHIGATGE